MMCTEGEFFDRNMKKLKQFETMLGLKYFLSADRFFNQNFNLYSRAPIIWAPINRIVQLTGSIKDNIFSHFAKKIEFKLPLTWLGKFDWMS